MSDSSYWSYDLHQKLSTGVFQYPVMVVVVILLSVCFSGSAQAAQIGEKAVAASYGWTSILPPLVAIAVALLWKSVIPALFIGVFFGAWLLHDLKLTNLGQALLDPFQKYAVSALANESHVSIVMFTMMMGGMIGILSKNGGMQGIVNRLMGFTRTRKRGQLVTASLGGVIFFDDVANTLLIGKTMRPLCDKLRISRQKLAYLIDSTAAPIASVAFATTWIGYEVSVIQSSLEVTKGLDMQPYSIFLASVPYSFYSFLTLFMVFVIAWTGRDFGPMYKAELLASRKGVVEPSEDENTQDGSIFNAVLPIAALVIALITGLMVTGEGDTFREILGSADSYKALMWSSFIGVMVAGAITLIQRKMGLEKLVDSWIDGMQTTFAAMIVLVLSWSLADITQLLDTSTFLISFFGDKLYIGVLPTVAFVIAGAIAFSTGTSWGTMGIMMPLILPLTWSMVAADDMVTGDEWAIFSAAIAAILSGATWGDHCSPISDTTILSAVASDCPLMDHVKTQVPYAALTGVLTIALCTIPVGFGVPWYVCTLVSLAVIIWIVKRFGKKVEDGGVFVRTSVEAQVN